MATDIFDKPFSDHVVFDRIVDADRNIALARQAADKAEAEGKPEKAAVLRAKADHLEALLNATQQPTYDDVDEDPPQGSGSSGDSGNDSGNQQGKGDQDEDQGQGPKADDGDQDADNGGGSDDSSSQDSAEDDPTQGDGSGDGKTPEDILNIDQHSGSHASGTLKNNQGGGGSAGGSGGGEGGSGSPSSQNQNKNSKNKQKELDPFRRSLGGNSQQGEQPDPQQILDAVIKRLSRLSGNAKVGADRALQQLFDELGGQGDIND